MVNIADLEKKAKKQAGRKTESAKKGMDFLFTQQVKASPQAFDSHESDEVSDKQVVEVGVDSVGDVEKIDMLRRLEQKELELKKREEELKRSQLELVKQKEKAKLSSACNNMIQPVHVDEETSLYLDGRELSPSSVIKVLDLFINKYSKSHFSAYATIIEETRNGLIQDCPIKRDTFQKNKVQRSELNRCLSELAMDGWIDYKEGKLSKSDKYYTKFFTILEKKI